MSGLQRIFVVSTTVDEAGLAHLKAGLGRDPLVLTAPTADAERVVRALAVQPRVELLLAPVSFPEVTRGHRLDELVRRHAVRDRFRDVVVVSDAASVTLLLRVLAPDQLSGRGAVTTVGLARGGRPVDLWRAVITGVALGVAAGLTEREVPILSLPVGAALVGLVLLIVPEWRHLGRELLLAAGIATVAVFLLVAGSARFPGGW